jgi:hypothetical protein
MTSSQPQHVWFDVVDSSGRSYREAGVGRVQLSSSADVDDFKVAVRLQYTALLSGITSSELMVYKSIVSFDNKEEPLDEDSILVGLGLNAAEDALIVLVSRHRSPTQGMVGSELTQFWTSLRTLSADSDNVIHFPTCPEFFPRCLRSLYVRQSYADLFEIVVRNRVLPEMRCNRMAITGSPGIGKSIFLFYVMWRLSKFEKPPTVILRRQNDGSRIYVFQKDECWTTMKPYDISSLLQDATVWYLTDSLLEPPGEIIKATTILVSSPARRHYRKFIDYSCTAPLHYLPVWTVDELVTASKEFGMTHDEVEERYYLIGGVPRFVLEKTSHDIVAIIDEAIARLKICEFKQIAACNLPREEEICYLVVHFEVNWSYQSKIIFMGSRYIADRAVELFLEKDRQNLMRFLSFPTQNSLPAPVLGNLFKA